VSATAAAAFPAAATIGAGASPPAAPGRSPPWIALGMLVMFASFGGVGGWVFFSQQRATSPAPIALGGGVAPTPTASASSTTSPVVSVVPADPVASAAGAAPSATSTARALAQSGAPRTGTGGAGAQAAAPSTTAPANGGRSLDLHGIAGGNTIAPTDEMTSDSAKAAGQCVTEGQVQQVLGQHSVAIRRACWERNGTTKLAANVSVSMTIAADGSAQNVSASGDDPAVAHCIENDVRNWRFPSTGCSQKIAVPFKFVRQ
jgi:hypothetical protein